MFNPPPTAGLAEGLRWREERQLPFVRGIEGSGGAPAGRRQSCALVCQAIDSLGSEKIFGVLLNTADAENAVKSSTTIRTGTPNEPSVADVCTGRIVQRPSVHERTRGA